MAQCRKCGAEIHWHKSKSGKSYPTDSAIDRTAFHKCDGAPSSPQPKAQAALEPIEATLSELVEALESTVAGLVRRLKEFEGRVPVGDQDIPW